MTHNDKFIFEFLNQDLPNRNGVETVILCGSYASGKATKHSDVDLCYIGRFQGFQRESILSHGHEFQLMIAPWSWYEHVVKDYERKGNIGTITVMLACGKCLIGDSANWQRLRNLASHYYNEGPSAPSMEDIRKIRVQLTDLWEDYCDKTEDLERLWLSFEIVRKCVEALFLTRRWWSVKPKYQLEEIKLRDSKMAELIVKCLSSPSTKEDLETICSYVLEPVGGWMKESWKAK